MTPQSSNDRPVCFGVKEGSPPINRLKGGVRSFIDLRAGSRSASTGDDSDCQIKLGDRLSALGRLLPGCAERILDPNSKKGLGETRHGVMPRAAMGFYGLKQH